MSNPFCPQIEFLSNADESGGLIVPSSESAIPQGSNRNGFLVRAFSYLEEKKPGVVEGMDPMELFQFALANFEGPRGRVQAVKLIDESILTPKGMDLALDKLTRRMGVTKLEGQSVNLTPDEKKSYAAPLVVELLSKVDLYPLVNGLYGERYKTDRPGVLRDIASYVLDMRDSAQEFQFREEIGTEKKVCERLRYIATGPAQEVARPIFDDLRIQGIMKFSLRYLAICLAVLNETDTNDMDSWKNILSNVVGNLQLLVDAVDAGIDLSKK